MNIKEEINSIVDLFSDTEDVLDGLKDVKAEAKGANLYHVNEAIDHIHSMYSRISSINKELNKDLVCAGQSPKSGLDCRMSTRCKHHIRFTKDRDKSKHVHTLLNESINERCNYFDEIEEEE